MHMMCTMEELMPSIGTSVPSPSLLAVIICKSDSTLQCVGKLYSTGSRSSSFDMDFDNPFDFCDEPLSVYKTHLISISDDGKIWNWLLTSERTEDAQKDATNVGNGAGLGDVPVLETNTSDIDGTADLVKQPDCVTSIRNCSSYSTLNQIDLSPKVCDHTFFFYPYLWLSFSQ